MFTADLLMQFIRNYGEKTQADFTSFLEKSLQFFTDQQEMFHEQLSKPLKNTPGELWLNMGKQQMDAWQDMQKQFLESLASSTKK